MSEESSEEPKLIIDEDWKTQVQREKDELEQKKSASAEADDSEAAMPSSSVDNAASGDASPEAKSEDSADIPPPPPASFSFLLTSLATQAVASMGQLPGEEGESFPVNLGYAKHFIDLIGVIEEKTQGNLSAEEERAVKDTLHQLRMMFVAASQNSKS